MNLILSGGGDSKISKGVDSLFTSLLINNNILYIPIAMDENNISYPDCLNLNWCKNSMSTYGKYKVTMWTETDLENKSYDDLTSFGGIFIGGGNTFYLLNEFNKTKFGEKLVKLLKETEIPVIGGSAGALIFSQNIYTAIPYDENEIDLKDLTGYKLTDGYDLWVHYQNDMKNLIQEYTKMLNTKIIALAEDSGLLVTNDSIKVVGDGSVTIFPEDKQYTKDSLIKNAK